MWRRREGLILGMAMPGCTYQVEAGRRGKTDLQGRRTRTGKEEMRDMGRPGCRTRAGGSRRWGAAHWLARGQGETSHGVREAEGDGRRRGERIWEPWDGRSPGSPGSPGEDAVRAAAGTRAAKAMVCQHGEGGERVGGRGRGRWASTRIYECKHACT